MLGCYYLNICHTSQCKENILKKWYIYYGCADSKVGVAICDPANPTDGDAIPNIQSDINWRQSCEGLKISGKIFAEAGFLCYVCMHINSMKMMMYCLYAECFTKKNQRL
jgi:hypothetical protein